MDETPSLCAFKPQSDRPTTFLQRLGLQLCVFYIPALLCPAKPHPHPKHEVLHKLHSNL